MHRCRRLGQVSVLGAIAVPEQAQAPARMLLPRNSGSPSPEQAAPQSAPRTVPRRGCLAALAGGDPGVNPRDSRAARAPH